MESLRFDGWSGVARTLLLGTLAYVALLFMLRVSGKRTLSKMNAFDFIVTVAPELAAYRGRLLDAALRRTRVTEDEVRAVRGGPSPSRAPARRPRDGAA